jgi:predicted phosphodiesterase
MEGIEKERTGPELRYRILEQAHADVLIVGHTHTEFELTVNVPPGRGRILNSGACCSKTYAFKPSGSLAVPDGFRPATFGVLELPSQRFKVFRALDGERVSGISPDKPCNRAPRKAGK